MDPNTPHLRPNKGILLLTWLLLTVAGSAYAQQIFKGTVSGREGIPLSGATVSFKGTNTSTLTDNNGRFSLKADPGTTLIISFVGYQNREIILGGESILMVYLTESMVNLDEVVAVGYGTARRKDVTGAVSKITAKDFNTGVITSPMQQIQGKVAGLVIVQPGGDPNSDYSVRIRGASSLEGQPPLLVIDGIAIDDFNKAITTLNPADIESFDILKDASAAAIYGARGANGVILVTTKRSHSGKIAIDYNGFVGLEKVANRIEVLSADQYRQATASIGGDAYDKGANTDWQKAITRSAFSQSHTIGLSAGADHFSFRGSVGYLKQNGVVINTGKEVITSRLTIDRKSFQDKLVISLGINTSVIKRDLLPDQTSTTQSLRSGSNIFDQTLHSLPVVPVYNPDGSYFTDGSNPVSPVYFLNEVYSKRRENFFQSSLKAEYTLVPGLRIGVLGALSRANDVFDYFFPAIPNYNIKSTATKGNYNKQIFTGDIHAGYRKVFAKHVIDLTGVYEYNQFLNDGFTASARGFLVSDLLNNNFGAATNIQLGDVTSYKDEVLLKSILGRAVYSYDDRYILTVNFRRDGSSKFGPNNRWGNFPSFAVAWRASSERFMKNIKWLNDLKLRVSYGWTGNQENLAPYPYQFLYGPLSPALYNGQIIQSYGVVQQSNPDLKWEVRKSFNMGLDFTVLNNRLSATIDVFHDQSSDMLFTYDLPQPPFLFDKVNANAANAINQGFEISLNAAIIRKKMFSWDAHFNLGTIKNRITNLSGQYNGANLFLTSEQQHYGYADGNGLSGAYITQLQKRYPAGVFWLPQHAGLDSAGRELFNNYDANGKLTGTSTTYSDQDRVYIDPTPHFSWGLTNIFNYGNFDLSFFIRGVQGQKIFANSIMTQEATVYLPFNNVTVKALTNGFSEQPQPSDYWLRNGSYTRLDNLTIGYNFKGIHGINRLRAYLSALNLFVLTAYEGIDPEVKTEGSQRYIDKNYYPRTRGMTLGVNVAF